MRCRGAAVECLNHEEVVYYKKGGALKIFTFSFFIVYAVCVGFDDEKNERKNDHRTSAHRSDGTPPKRNESDQPVGPLASKQDESMAAGGVILLLSRHLPTFASPFPFPSLDTCT